MRGTKMRRSTSSPADPRRSAPAGGVRAASVPGRRPITRRGAALLAAAFLGACGGADRTTPAGDRHTLVDSRDTYDPRSLDPARSTDVPTGRAVGYVYEGLTRFTPDAQLAPALATRWTVSEDGRTYTFHLRDGVRFHDGSALDAGDVVHSFTRVLAPGSTGGRAWPLLPIAGAQNFADGRAPDIGGLTAPDDSTVVITLETPLAIFPKLLAMPVAAIVPAEADDALGESPVGTGPWRLAEWRHDDYVKFARFTEYWGETPGFDTLLARIIPEPSTAAAEFESGAVDLLLLPEDQTADWRADPARAARLVAAPSLRLWYIGVNVNRGPLGDARVRRAIAHAIDVPTLVERLLGGRGRAAAGVIPPSLAGGDATRAPHAYDVARARTLLAEAGHADGISLELWHSQSAPFPRLAEAIQAMLGDAGIRVTLVQRDAASVREAARNGQVDLILKDWFADYPDAENFLYPLLHSANHGVGGNVSFYADATFDALVDTARIIADDARRETLYRRADSLAFADVGLVPLLFGEDVYAVQPWVEGFAVPVIFNGQQFRGVRLR